MRHLASVCFSALPPPHIYPTPKWLQPRWLRPSPWTHAYVPINGPALLSERSVFERDPQAQIPCRFGSLRREYETEDRYVVSRKSHEHLLLPSFDTLSFPKKSKSRTNMCGFYFLKHTQNAGDNLLSPFRSTIGSRGLDFRVRNGNGYDPSDKSPAFWARFCSQLRTYSSRRICIGMQNKENVSDTQNSAPETGHISTSRLNTLLCVHLKPINLIIYKVSHNDS